jgi:cellulose synthase/poly-beta-1,6-N-acetylglucosamine synthase-like glycosyltransferase
MKIREKGFRILFDPEAVAYEETAPNVEGEYRRRVRIGAGNFQSIALTRRLLNPVKGTVAMTFWSHKVLRWCVPFLMLTTSISNLILLDQGTLYLYCMYIQIFVYLLAALGINRNFSSIIFKVPHYFVSMNLAILVGFFRYLRGSQRAAWERTQR